MDRKTLPLVSMISVFYNRSYCVIDSVQSMINQNYRNLEIILVDDGSTDSTLDKLRKFESSKVKVVSFQNVGFTNAIKKAIDEISNGELIAIHGSGDVSYPDRVKKQVEYMQQNPDTGVVGCGCEVYSEKTKESHFAIKPFKIGQNNLLNRGANVFSHGEVMIRKSIYNVVGGYRQEFVYAQDYDLWLRINEHSSLARFSDVLYLEFGRHDGVRNHVDKAVKQKKFSQLAMHSAYSRMQGHDILNSINDDVFAPLKGSEALSNRFARLALREMASGDLKLSKAYITEAVYYKNSYRLQILDFIGNNSFLLQTLGAIRKIRLKYRSIKLMRS